MSASTAATNILLQGHRDADRWWSCNSDSFVYLSLCCMLMCPAVKQESGPGPPAHGGPRWGW